MVAVKCEQGSKISRFHGVLDDETISQIWSYTKRGSAGMRDLHELAQKRKERLGKGTSEEAEH